MKCKKIFLFFLPLGIMLISVTLGVSADVNYDDSTIFNIGNENYTFPASGITFSEVAYNETGSWIRFNNTDFNVTSTNPINISVSYLNSNIPSAENKEKTLEFDANTNSGLVYFNLSGFRSNTKYTVTRTDDSGNEYMSVYETSGGILRFTNDDWSTGTFTIHQGDLTPEEDPGTPTPPTTKEYLIEIYVNYNGNPLSEAEVTVSNDETLTDQEGYTSYMLPEGNYTVYVYKETYGLIKKLITVTETETITIDYNPPEEEKDFHDRFDLPGFTGVELTFTLSLFILIGYVFYRKKER